MKLPTNESLTYYIRGSRHFLYRHLKLSKTHENKICYCYTSYEMTDQVL